jgi:hypothetical protein
MKSVGNIWFIDELFKLGRLTTNIMQHCTQLLLMKEDEGPLECSCELLNTDGKDFENKNQDLSEHLSKIKEIYQKRGLGSCCGL